MIAGLSHVGLTVSEMDNSLGFYQRVLGCRMLNDSERKGDWIDKITGIPGFHTRTVYLAVTPYKHLEFFQFYNPKSLPPDKEADSQVGIRYCAFAGEKIRSLSNLQDDSKQQRSVEQTSDFEQGINQRHRVKALKDPDGLSLRVIEFENEETRIPDASVPRLLYPALVVKDLESSLRFYRDSLGLEIDGQGDPLTEKRTVTPREPGGQCRWAVLRGQGGPCLKLVEPREVYVQPAGPWLQKPRG